jgi:hypothetical protein
VKLIEEVVSLWHWTIGIVAGWGLTTTLLVVALIIAYIRISKLKKQIEASRNEWVTESRELSMRLRKIEDQ